LFFIEQAEEFNRVVADFLAGGHEAIAGVRRA